MARSLNPLRLGTRPRLSLPNTALASTALVLVLGIPLGAASAKPPPDPEAERRPAPQTPRVERFDPDVSTCRPENLLRGYRSQLAMFADQPPAAQARLRRLQRDLAVGSINGCIQRGLLNKQQARTLAASMGIDRDGKAQP